MDTKDDLDVVVSSGQLSNRRMKVRAGKMKAISTDAVAPVIPDALDASEGRDIAELFRF